MIRINLLPVRRAAQAQTAQRQLIAFAAVFLALIGILFFLHDMQVTELGDKQREVRELEADIAKLKSEVGDFDRLKQQRDTLLSQRKVINDLQAQRSGPVRLMRELSDIMSVGKGPTVDQAKYEQLLRRDASSGYNPNWNPRRMTLTELKEKNGGLEIRGNARDHDDVAEFMRRLMLSIHFDDVQLHRNDQVEDAKSKAKLVKFSLSCKAKALGQG